MTNDVEETSLVLNRLDDSTAWQIFKDGLPKLLNLYSKYDIESTFYFTGTFAEMIPESIDLVMDYGHEIGCHGYSHEVDRAFDVLNYQEQVRDLFKAKRAIEAIAGRIESFRAPAARINKYTVKALEKVGFTTDSSVASQRFDGPLTFGAINKLNWLFAPRMPYKMSYKSPFMRGNSKILEVPISAFISPYIGTTMRVAPNLNRVVEGLLFKEAKNKKKPIVFLFHPVEVIENFGKVEVQRRATSFSGYVFGDLIRQKFKLKNLGNKALKLMDNTLKRAEKAGFDFISVRKYKSQHHC